MAASGPFILMIDFLTFFSGGWDNIFEFPVLRSIVKINDRRPE